MRWIRRILIGGGIAVIAYAARGVLREASVGTWPYLRFLAVSAVFADAFVLPVVLAAGAVAARWLPSWLRVPVQAALYVSAAVTLISTPLVLGYGRDSSLPSALPRDYPRGLLIVLAVVWSAALAAALVRRRRVRPALRAAAPRNDSRP